MADSEEMEVWENESERAWLNDEHNVEFGESIVVTLKEILQPNARILDAGCGIGKNVRAFKKLGYEVEGLDQSKKAIEYARILNPDGILMNIRIQQMSMVDYYDLIHTCAVLQHSIHERKRDILRKFHQALKSGGYLLFTECIFPNGKESDGYSFTHDGWVNFMAENGFEYVKTIPPWPYCLFQVIK